MDFMINKCIKTINNNSRILRRIASKKYFDNDQIVLIN